MSQTKVNSFFLLRKGTRDGHAAKRRKLESLSADQEIRHDKQSKLDLQLAPNKQTLSLLDLDLPAATAKSFVPPKQTESLLSSKYETNVRIDLDAAPKTNLNPGQKSKSSRSRSSSRLSKGVSSKSTNVVAKQSENGTQQKLTDFKFSPAASNNSISEVQPSTFSFPGSNIIVSSADSGLKGATVSAAQGTVSISSSSMENGEEITSFLDDHNDNLSQEGMTTPRKKIVTVEATLSQGPVSRKRKTAVRKLGNEARSRSDVLVLASGSITEDENVAIRKKLILHPSDNAKPADYSDQTPCTRDKSGLLAAVSEICESPEAISPLAPTPDRPSTPPVLQSSSPKLHDLSEKLQVLSKMNGKALKNRLKQKGLLKDCKEQLGELTRAVEESGSTSEVCSNKEESDLPAYQRFEYLAKEGPPTLSLPFSYRLLESAFQAMDTVVSMLHNRSEICTFSKLKAAVQVQTRKNFEQKTIGQINTVLPDAYLYRQEKNLPSFGQKTSGYQLTIEANLSNCDSNTPVTKTGKPTFSIKLMQNRKGHFKHRLFQLVKHHHKKFLASLTPPLNIPDSKLSRWHPRFRLDEVPGIPASDLPQPPDTKVCRSAKDVLEIFQKGKSNTRVEQALQRVISEASTSESHTESHKENSNLNSEDRLSVAPVNAPHFKETVSSLRGIPPALLAKIRAKEARKMEESLTKDPMEDKKTKMMGRLPEFIRILRTFFVTEKKPAIPLATILKKLGDSYKNGMSLGSKMAQGILLVLRTCLDNMTFQLAPSSDTWEIEYTFCSILLEFWCYTGARSMTFSRRSVPQRSFVQSTEQQLLTWIQMPQSLLQPTTNVFGEQLLPSEDDVLSSLHAFASGEVEIQIEALSSILKSSLTVLQRQLKDFLTADELPFQLREKVSSAPTHNMASERTLGCLDKMLRRAPIATGGFLNGKVRSKMNKCTQWLDTLAADEREGLISFAIAEATDDRVRKCILEKLVVKTIGKRREEVAHERTRKNKASVEKSLSKALKASSLEELDCGGAVKDRIQLFLQEKDSLVGVAFIHCVDKLEFYGRIHSVVDTSIVVGYWGLEESETNSVDHNVSIKSFFADVILDAIVFL